METSGGVFRLLLSPLFLLILLLTRLNGNSEALDEAAVASVAEDVNVLCRRCGATITKLSYALTESETPPNNGRSERISDSAEEYPPAQHETIVSRFKNKVGQTFDVALFKSAQVNSVASSRSVQDAFFPGYAWRIAECSVCGAFLGWSFDRPAHCHLHHSAGDEEEMSEQSVEEQKISTNPEEILEHMFSKTCLTKNLGFWNVEWCHRKSIQQFHISGATMKRDPEYSLGEFSTVKEPTIVQSKLNMLIPGTIGLRQILEHAFVNGQRCDETNAPRSTTVSIVCCMNYHQSLGPMNAPFIASLREPETCSYEMVICVPELCKVPGFAPPVMAKVGDTAVNSQSPASDEQVCASGSPPRKSPQWFFGLEWSALITETSPEMFWTRTLHPVIGTGQFVM